MNFAEPHPVFAKGKDSDNIENWCGCVEVFCFAVIFVRTFHRLKSVSSRFARCMMIGCRMHDDWICRAARNAGRCAYLCFIK